MSGNVGNGAKEEVEVNMAADMSEDQATGRQRCSSLTLLDNKSIAIYITQAAFLSLALSLLATGFILTSIAAGVRSLLAISILIYTSYASLGAMSLVVLMVIYMNILSVEGDD